MKIRHIGTGSYNELSLTGTNALWQPEQVSDVSTARASALLALGTFVYEDDTTFANQLLDRSAELAAVGGVIATTNLVTGEITFSGPNGVQVRTSSAPRDALTTPIQHSTIYAAISTTVVASATASGTFYRARVAWNNNGASASAKLNIVLNAVNDVHGLVAGQNAKRRDYQMTMGDAVILISEVPITSLHFSSDTAISINTHQLQVTFGN